MDVRDALMVGRNTDGKLVKRPLSPHLQVYRLPMTAITSIGHRISGVVLSIGLLVLAWWLLAAATGPSSFDTAQGILGSFLGRLVLFGWTVAICFHLVNGLRHLVWDAGYGFEIGQASRTSHVIPMVAAGLAVLLWVVILFF